MCEMEFDILAGDCVKDDIGRFWIWDRVHNVIGFIENRNFCFHIAAKYEDDTFDGFNLYLNDHVIYITSQFKTEILAYYMLENKFHIFRTYLMQKASQYHSSRLNENKIVLIAFEIQYPYIIFDMRTGLFEQLYLFQSDRYRGKRLSKLTSTNDEILCSFSGSNEIAFISKKNLSFHSKYIDSIKEIGGIFADSINDIWIISKNGENLIRCLDDKERKISLGEKRNGDMFSRLVRFKNKIIALPRCAMDLYVYDILSEKVGVFKLPDKLKVREGNASLFWNCFEREDKLILLPWGSQNIVELNLNTMQMKICVIKIAVSEFYKHEGLPKLVNEKKEMDLHIWYEIVENEKKEGILHGDIGKTIWKRMIKI